MTIKGSSPAIARYGAAGLGYNGALEQPALRALLPAVAARDAHNGIG